METYDSQRQSRDWLGGKIKHNETRGRWALTAQKPPPLGRIACPKELDCPKRRQVPPSQMANVLVSSESSDKILGRRCTGCGLVGLLPCTNNVTRARHWPEM